MCARRCARGCCVYVVSEGCALGDAVCGVLGTDTICGRHNSFPFRRAAFYNGLKSKVGLACGQHGHQSQHRRVWRCRFSCPLLLERPSPPRQPPCSQPPPPAPLNSVKVARLDRSRGCIPGPTVISTHPGCTESACDVYTLHKRESLQVLGPQYYSIVTDLSRTCHTAICGTAQRERERARARYCHILPSTELSQCHSVL